MRSTVVLLSVARRLVCGRRPTNQEPLEAHVGQTIGDTGLDHVPIAAGPQAVSRNRLICYGGSVVVGWAPMRMGAGPSLVGHEIARRWQKPFRVGNNLRGAPMGSLMYCLATRRWERVGSPFHR